MRLLRWWSGRGKDPGAARLDAWRAEWATAVAAEDGAQVTRLRSALEALGLSADDLEIETEMLEGLAALSVLAMRLRGNDLPIVATGHRVVGTDTCHLSAPASLPDDAAQSTGRVILTDQRVIFAGGGRAISIAWHRISRVLRTDRDLLLVLNDQQTAHRFRFNSFADALCGAALANHLARQR